MNNKKYIEWTKEEEKDIYEMKMEDWMNNLELIAYGIVINGIFLICLIF